MIPVKKISYQYNRYEFIPVVVPDRNSHNGMKSYAHRYHVNATLTPIPVLVVKSWWTGTIGACVVIPCHGDLGFGVTNGRSSSTNFMNSFLLILKFFLQSSSKQRFWIMFCHHKSVLPGFTQKRLFPRIFRFLRMQRDKGEHTSAVARAILCRLTTIWLSKIFAIVFANVIAEAEKENILYSSASLDAIIVLVHASSVCQYLCRPCKRGMKLTTRTRMKLVPVWDFTCKHPFRLIVIVICHVWVRGLIRFGPFLGPSTRILNLD